MANDDKMETSEETCDPSNVIKIEELILPSTASENESDSGNEQNENYEFSNKKTPLPDDSIEITDIVSLSDPKAIKANSLIWKFFKTIKNTSVCKFCNATIKTSGSTSNIRKHMKMVHLINIDKIQNEDWGKALPKKEENKNIVRITKLPQSNKKIEQSHNTMNALDNKSFKDDKRKVFPSKKPNIIPSDVWNYFNRVDKSTAVCNLCNRNLKTSGNTTNLRGHLTKVHFLQLTNVRNYEPPSKIKNADPKRGIKDEVSIKLTEPLNETLEETSEEISTSPNEMSAEIAVETKIINISLPATAETDLEDDSYAHRYTEKVHSQTIISISNDETEEKSYSQSNPGEIKDDEVSDTESEASTNAKKNPKIVPPRVRSEIWKYFEKKDNDYASCKLCDTTLKCCGNTTNLRNHFKRVHSQYLTNCTVTDPLRAKNSWSLVWGYFVQTGRFSAICKICNSNLRTCGNSSNLRTHLKKVHRVNLRYAPNESIIRVLKTAHLKFKQKKTKYMKEKNRKFRSKIWSFYQMQPDNSITCKLCEKNLVTKKLSNLARHLKNKHSDVLLNNLGRNCTRTDLHHFYQHTVNSPLPSLSPEKSLVWNYFIQNDDSSASCIYCEKKLQTKKSSNLLRHIKRKHASNMRDNICDSAMALLEESGLQIVQRNSKNMTVINFGRQLGHQQRSRSEVWNYFTKNDNSSATCQLCQKNLKTSGNTSNLRSHIEKVHTKKLTTKTYHTYNNAAETLEVKYAEQRVHKVNMNNYNKLKSKVWHCFNRDNLNSATCKFCDKTIITGGNTTNLRIHLERVHAMDINAMPTYATPDTYKKEKQSPKVKREKSKVWEFFKRNEDYTATCIMCAKTLRTSGNTSNLRNHMDSIHSMKISNVQKYNSNNTQLVDMTKTSDVANESIDCKPEIENDQLVETVGENFTPENKQKNATIDIVPIVFTSEVSEIECENAPYDNQVEIENSQSLDDSSNERLEENVYSPVENRNMIIVDNVEIEDNSNVLSSIPYTEETEIASAPATTIVKKKSKRRSAPMWPDENLKSEVWNYFRRVNADYATCKVCEKTLKTSGNTTNLRNHVSNVHHLNLGSTPNNCSMKILEKAQKICKNFIPNKQTIPVTHNTSKKQQNPKLKWEKSNIWEYFERNDNFSATCKVCDKIVKTSENMINLHNHIESAHPPNMVYIPNDTMANMMIEHNQENITFKNEMSTARAPIRSKSKVWNYFERHEDRTATCKICNKTLKTSRNTTNLLNHVEKVHGQKVQTPSNIDTIAEYVEIEEAVSPKPATPENQTKIIFGQKGIQKVIKLDVGEIFYVVAEPDFNVD